MKTTIEIADALFEAARKTASRDHTTVRALVEEGLRRVVEERQRPVQFRLRNATVGGKGLKPALVGAPWDRIRELSYEGRS